MIVDSDEETDVLKMYLEVVNYLLETYATDEEIAMAYAEVISCKQETDKTEAEFVEHVRAKARRFVSVFFERRLKSIFVDGLLPGIQATVRNRLGTARGLSYTQLTQYAQALGDSRRSVQVCSAMCLAGREHSPTVKQKEENSNRNNHCRWHALRSVRHSLSLYVGLRPTVAQIRRGG